VHFCSSCFGLLFCRRAQNVCRLGLKTSQNISKHPKEAQIIPTKKLKEGVFQGLAKKAWVLSGGLERNFVVGV
jgi:hypothetical protein